MNLELPNYWDEVVARAHGPMKIRLLLQPCMAALFAVRAGRRDAREGRRPYLWPSSGRPRTSSIGGK